MLSKIIAALKAPQVTQKPISVPASVAVKHPVFASPSYDQLERFFGPAGGRLATAGRVDLPVPFKLAWDPSKAVMRFSCHALLEDVFESVFSETVKHYGERRFSELRLDMFGGCYANRQMRGGSKLSVHSWGAAVDLDPERNQLKWTSKRAAFASAEYEPFWRIVEAHGAVSLGRARNYDWMHVQFCKA